MYMHCFQDSPTSIDSLQRHISPFMGNRLIRDRQVAGDLVRLTDSLCICYSSRDIDGCGDPGLEIPSFTFLALESTKRCKLV